MNRRLVLSIFLVGLIGFLFWWFSTVQILKRRTVSLLETAEVPSSMSDIGRGARGPNLANYLDERVRLSPPDELSGEIASSFTRDQVAALYSTAAKYCTRIEFEDPRFESIEVDGEEARVRFRVDAVADFPGRRPADGDQIVDLTWRKVEGDWLVSSMAWEETARP